MHPRIILTTVIFLHTIFLFSQDFNKQRIQFTAFNVGFNGLVGGVGSMINKKENQNTWKAFTKGFYRGAIGGAVSHVGFSMTSLIRTKEQIAYAWPARLVNAFGSSIVLNAASNNRMLEQIHFNLYVSRLEYHPFKRKIKARLFTSSIYGILIAGRNARLDISKSLQSGVIYFESDENFRSQLLEGPATGQVSSVGMGSFISGPDYYSIFAHEVAHILQFDRKVAGNAFAIRLDKKFKEKSGLYTKLSKVVYFDLNGPIFFYAYKFQSDTHNCNFFEQEAEHYSGRRYYGCHH